MTLGIQCSLLGSEDSIEADRELFEKWAQENVVKISATVSELDSDFERTITVSMLQVLILYAGLLKSGRVEQLRFLAQEVRDEISSDQAKALIERIHHSMEANLLKGVAN